MAARAGSSGPRSKRNDEAADLLALARHRPRRTTAPRRRRPASAIVREAIDTLDGRVSGLLERGQIVSLDERDPEFIDTQVRWMAPLVEAYFRADVRSIDKIPAAGPALCVGNHSGGLLTPDTWVLMASYFQHFGTERLTYALAHSVVMGLPVIGDWLRRVGTLPAHPENARAALRQGAAVLVYPGGDEDVFRSWAERNRIHLARRTGFVRLAIQEGVPLVPIVSVGGHETAFIVGNGPAIASALGVDRLRIKSLPLVIAPPWGVSPGDLLGHIPLPAKITVEVGDPIDFSAEFGRLDPRDPEVIWACYQLVEVRMQQQLDRLASERRWPILG